MSDRAAHYEIRPATGGYRIWNRRCHQWWGDLFRESPDELLAELNGRCRPPVVRMLVAAAQPARRSLLRG